MTDPTSLPNFTPNVSGDGGPQSATPARDRVLDVLRTNNIDVNVDKDGDLEFVITDNEGNQSTLFARVAEGDIALVRFFGQWQLQEPVSADRAERLTRCNDFTLQLNLVKVCLVQDSLVVSAEHVITPGADLQILVPLSINHILQSVAFFFQSWLPQEGDSAEGNA